MNTKQLKKVLSNIENMSICEYNDLYNKVKNCEDVTIITNIDLIYEINKLKEILSPFGDIENFVKDIFKE